MPDSSGRFRPISVPRVPWHDFEDQMRRRFSRFDGDMTKGFHAVLNDDLPSLPQDDSGAEQISDVQDA